jgi:hypothetical protein
MKKTVCLLLALVLCLGLTLPAAAAAEPADEQMKAVILQVKKTLGISDDYTEFNGDSYVWGEQTWWQLSWWKEDESLSVTCDDQGKVFSYERWFHNEEYRYSDKLHFPDYTWDDAAKAAGSFLSKVLDKNEGVELTERQDSLRPSSRYSINGILTLNGVDTEVSVSLAFRTADGILLSFRRSDAETFIVGGVPSAVPAVSAAEALPKFRDALTTELNWVYTDYEKHEARLMYEISLGWGAYVDAQTGELLYRQEGFRGYDGGKNAAAAEPEAMDEEDMSLTPQELAGAEKFKNVLDGEALKAAVMKEAAFGITEDFALSTVTYTAAQPSVDPASLGEGETPDDTVTAFFRLSKVLEGPEFGLTQERYDELLEEGYIPTVWKYVTADARTGEVQSLYTGYNGFGWKEEQDTTPADLPAAARDFLERKYPDWLSLCELKDSSRSDWSVPVDSYYYIRMEAGYPCPMNSISLSVNAAAGCVDSFSAEWDEELTFGPSGPVVGETAAQDAFLGCYNAHLTYVLLREDPEDWQSACRRVLVYLPDSGDNWVSRVDAITGEPDRQIRSEELTVSYEDLAGSYARKEIEKLAAYGVGFAGVTEFRPKAAVTELDMILFMLSAAGGQLNYPDYENADEETLKPIYREAMARGFISSTEQHPGRTVTRSELCRCFVGLSGLTEAAEMRGIFLCGFTDDEAIPAADVGYVAIAKGLGVVQGDSAGAFRPTDGATRQELALMLYRYLSR